MTKLRPIDKIQQIKHLYMKGHISIDEALEKLKEPVAEINVQMAKVAKEFGKKPQVMTARGALRIRNFYA